MAKISFCALIAMHAIAVTECIADTRAKVGVLMPFSGEASLLGEKARQGFALAEEELQGEVQVIYEDVGGLGVAKAVSGAHKLLDVDGVSVLVGPFGPEQTIPVAAIAGNHDVAVVSFSLCSGAFRSLTNVLCGYPSASVQLRSLLPNLRVKGIESLAVISQDSQYGEETEQALAENLASTSTQIAFRERVSAEQRDFRSLIAKLRRANPQAVFVVIADPAQAFSFLKQLWQGGYRGERFAYIDYDDKYLRDLGSWSDGIIVPGAFAGGYDPRFVRAFTERYRTAPDVYAALGYDLLRTAVKALENNRWHKRGLSDQIPLLPFTDTAIRGFRFLPDRSIDFPIGSLLVKDRRFVEFVPGEAERK